MMNEMLGMSDNRLNMIFNFITAFSVVIGPILIAWMNNITARKLAARVELVKQDLQTTQNASANEVTNVKKQLKIDSNTTAVKLASIEQLSHDTHALINRNLEIQLQINSLLARKMANMTNNVEDIQAAQLAEKIYNEHKVRQASFDQQISARISSEVAHAGSEQYIVPAEHPVLKGY